MAKKEKVLEIVYDAVEELNEQLPKKRRLEKKEDQALFGEGGKLDSLNLVNLIVNIEALIDEELDKTVTLADEKAMSMKNSPFRSVGTLADFIVELIDEN